MKERTKKLVRKALTLLVQTLYEILIGLVVYLICRYIF